MGEQDFCFGCGSQENLKKCGDCAKSTSVQYVPSYCGSKCQVKDWAVHKHICAKNDKVIEEGAWKIEYGDFEPLIIATRDIEAGRIVFQRKPLLTFTPDPSPSIDEARLNNPATIAFLSGSVFELDTRKFDPISRLPSCLSCHEVIPDGKGKHYLNKCRMCTWPVHSNVLGMEPSPCEKAHEHECSFLRASGLTWDEAINIPGMGSGIGLLRAWLLPEDKKKQLLDMPKPTPEMTSLFLQSKEAETMKSFVLETCGIKPNFKNELEDLMIAIVGNSLKAVTPKKSSPFKVIFEGGPTGRIMSHNCVPNCVLYIGPDLTGTFRTIKKVRKGETLTISLIGEASFAFSVLTRTNQLGSFYTKCHCPRCTTSDEDGKFLSAIRSKDSNGEYYLPIRNKEAAASVDNLFTWHCPSAINKPVLSQTTVEKLFTPIFVQFMSPPGQSLEDKFEYLKAMIKAFEDSALFHKNHEVILSLKILLACASRDLFLSQHFHLNSTLIAILKSIAKGVEIYENFGGGFTLRYAGLLITKGFVEMRVLSDEIKASKGTLGIEVVGKRIQSALKDCHDGIKMQTIAYPNLEPFDFHGKTVVLKIIEHELLEVVHQYYPINGLKTLQGVKSLRKMFWKGRFEELKLALEQQKAWELKKT